MESHRYGWALGLVLCLNNAAAADFSGYATLTSDYVFRGVSYSGENPSAQLGVDVGFENGFYLGAWAATIDINNGPGRQRDLELDYYVGYSHNVSDKWALGGSVVAYTFPGTSGFIDYDYVEYMFNANFNDSVWLEVTYSPNLFSSGRSTRGAAITGARAVAAKLDVSGSIGYYDVADLTGNGYAYWELGITRTIGRVAVDLRYHDSSRWVPIISRPAIADGRLVLSAKLQF